MAFIHFHFIPATCQDKELGRKYETCWDKFYQLGCGNQVKVNFWVSELYILKEPTWTTWEKRNPRTLRLGIELEILRMFYSANWDAKALAKRMVTSSVDSNIYIVLFTCYTYFLFIFQYLLQPFPVHTRLWYITLTPDDFTRNLPWLHVRRVLSSLTLPNIAGFLPVLRFTPWKPDPWRVAVIGFLGRTV